MSGAKANVAALRELCEILVVQVMFSLVSILRSL